MFEEGEEMCGARKAWGQSGGVVVGNCGRMSFLVSDPVLPDSGWARNTTQVFLEISKIFGRPSSKQFATSTCRGFGQVRRQKYVQGETV